MQQHGDMFGCVLKEGERYTDVQALDKKRLGWLCQADSLYVVDSRGQRYPMPVNELVEQKKRVQQHQEPLQV